MIDTRFLRAALRSAVVTSTMALAASAPATAAPEPTSAAVTAGGAYVDEAGLARVYFREAEVDGVTVAYREAGDPQRPTVLLLHGFPTSSHMFRNLMPVLGAHYHLLAPDYPGYGASEMPDRKSFDYSFANYARLVDLFVQQQGVSEYALYLMDYGAPVGFRLFALHPERATAFVIQNGNAYEEGLQAFWDPIKAYWREPTAAHRDALRPFLEIDGTRWQYLHGVPDPESISPDNWHHDQYLLDRPGNKEIQLDLFLDYGTNVVEYPKWQALFREHQPPALLVWGQNDEIFPADGAHPYRSDLETLEFHLLDAGHFALETHGGLIAGKMREFLDAELGGRR